MPKKLLCILLAGLTGCSTTGSQYGWRDLAKQPSGGVQKASQNLESWGAKPAGPDVTDPELAPGYLLTLHSLTDSKMNGDFRVGFEGDLQLPYDQTLNVTGLTLSQVKRKLADLYRPYFKTPTDIEVRIKERRYWVDVRGLVEKPGRYLVDAESSLDYVIGMAGGPSKAEPPLYVRIQKGTKVFVFDLTQYYSHGEDHPQILGWLGGEVLFFQKEMAGSVGERTGSYRLPIYMLGEVRKPGGYTLTPGSDFVDSLVQAGGFTDRADLDDIEIIRKSDGVKRVYDFSWQDFQHAPAPIQGDVVFIHANNETRTERHTLLFVSIISMLASVVTATVFVLAYNRGRI